MITGKTLLSVEQINKRVSELAEKISSDYRGKEIMAVGILKGAFMFYADLIRALSVSVKVDFIVSSSYLKSSSTGEVKVHYDIKEDIAGKHILLIDDIADTGISLNHIRERVLSQSPESLKICVFLDKKERRLVDVPIDYVGFDIPNEFVVGYGLDYNSNFRNLPYIAVFKKET